MKKLYLLCLLFIANYGSSLAQSFCANDFLVEKIYKKNPQFTSQQIKATAKWNDYNRALSTTKRIITGIDTSYEIPIVVHIVHTGDTIGSSFNPTDAEIENFIDFLNKTWDASWPTFDLPSAGGTKIPIKFVLAKRDPNCKPTNGILRVNGSVLPGYTMNGVCPFGFEVGPTDIEMKSLSVWPPSDYYNIWLVNSIEGGVANGYASWPWLNEPSLIDGAVVDVKFSRKISGDYSYTVAHEVGHSFGLYHTFQDGCDIVSPCTAAGDEICDTEPHDFGGSFTCTKGLVNSCTGTIYNGVENNFMNYTDCPSRFTPEQRKRIIYTLNNYRSGLITSLGAVPPDPAFLAPKTTCIPNIIHPESVYNNGPCVVQFSNLQAASLGYFMDAYESYIDRTCTYEAAQIQAGKTYDLSISTIGAPQEVAAWIDYNDDGIFQATEKIYAHSGSTLEETHIGSIAVPHSGVRTNRNLRMRIKSDIVPIIDACADLSDGQTEDFSVFITPGTSMHELGNEQKLFSFYPNPTHGKVKVKVDDESIITIYSIDGRLVWDGLHQPELDISWLDKGVYFIQAQRLYDGSNLGVQKLIKCD